MSGCSGTSSDDVDGTWGDPGDAAPQLVLATDGTLTGTDGCNLLNGRWRADGPDVEFSDTLSTLMACQGVDTWLVQLSSATVDGDIMTVMSADGRKVGTLAKQ
jgi:heat shock protein HslJ